MSWKKYFRAPNLGGNLSPISGDSSATPTFSVKNYQSHLPDVYVGHPNRIERYNQYEQMDADPEVNVALDILAEFSTQPNIENGTTFDINFNEKPTDNEIKIIKEQLRQWCKLNDFNKRMFKLFRNAIKYGDQVFVRDPETFKLLWTEMSKVTKVIVNESDGKSPEQYVLKELNPNLQNLTVTAVTTSDTYMNHPQIGGPVGTYTPTVTGSAGGSRFATSKNESVINAEHIIHISLTEGLDIAWPFGNSVLETIFKVFKQKELLEDSIIIYRVQRAPERRVFKIDVGNMPSHLAMAFVERVKNEVHQRRIPTQSGNGCFAMNTQVPLLDGRILTIAELSSEFENGKENWAYSCNPESGDMSPGLITWAGVTQKSAQVLELELDNGEIITCTPEHRFPILGKGTVEAKDIIPNQDSLISFSTRLFSIKNKKENNIKDPQYQQVYDHSSNSWNFTHRKVVSFFKDTNSQNTMLFDDRTNGEEKTVIHHRNFKKLDNSPNNLYCMSGRDHFLLHAHCATEYYESLNDDEKINLAKKKQQWFIDLPEDKKEEIKKHLLDLTTCNWIKIKSDIPLYDRRKTQLIQNLANMDSPWANQKNQFNDKMFNILSDLVQNQKSSLDQTLELLNANVEFMTLYSTLNTRQPGMIYKLHIEKFSKTTLRRLIKQYGFNNWKSFLKANGLSIKRPTRKLIWNNTIYKTTVELLNGVQKKSEAVTVLSSNLDFMNQFSILNKNIKGNATPTRFSGSTLNVLLSDLGYIGWSDFKEKIPLYNHKVTAIRYKNEPMEVGTLTIDGNHTYHRYHTFAIKQGVYTFNSPMLDATYNPISFNEDFFFPKTADNRGSDVTILPGGQQLGEITDLRFFTNKMFRGLRIPSSYLPTMVDEAANSFSDGKVGIAMIQEWRFNQYCKRLQNLIATTLDKEFKLFMRFRGINIDSSVFDLQFNEPQNFTKYRQVEIDSARIGTFTQLEQVPYLSKRFILERYLGLSEEEMQENEQMWAEEHADTEATKLEDANLRSVGVSAGSISTDMENITPMPGEGEEMGGTGAPVGVGQAPAGGAGGAGGVAPASAPSVA